jgi:glutamate--cysteine ligase
MEGPDGLLSGGLKGVEKESLRVFTDGMLAGTPHPKALGSAMTNGFITTDFSEALLEFVTPAMANTWETLRILCEIHQFTYERIGDELLWVNSMPCMMSGDDAIPLARYGTSNVGTMKTVYRNGLGYRYGRKMQTIAGVHFNYSLPEAFWPWYRQVEKSSLELDMFRSDAYMGLVRNFRRLGWLVLYLFGGGYRPRVLERAHLLSAICHFIEDERPRLHEQYPGPIAHFPQLAGRLRSRSQLCYLHARAGVRAHRR